MAAPTPVSAYLHSATMVKAGVFLLVRLWPALGGTNEWLWLVGSAGLITFILGAFFAVFQQDLKGLLAYSTISHLGLITLLTGLDTPARADRRDLPHHEPRDLQGVAVHGRRHHRSRNRHARHPAPERPVARSCRSRRRWPWSLRPPWRAYPCSTGFCRRRCSSPRRSRSTTTRSSIRRFPISSPWPACSRSPIRCALFATCSSARRRPICRARRMSRRS